MPQLDDAWRLDGDQVSQPAQIIGRLLENAVLAIGNIEEDDLLRLAILEAGKRGAHLELEAR